MQGFQVNNRNFYFLLPQYCPFDLSIFLLKWPERTLQGYSFIVYLGHLLNFGGILPGWSAIGYLRMFMAVQQVEFHMVFRILVKILNFYTNIQLYMLPNFICEQISRSQRRKLTKYNEFHSQRSQGDGGKRGEAVLWDVLVESRGISKRSFSFVKRCAVTFCNELKLQQQIATF